MTFVSSRCSSWLVALTGALLLAGCINSPPTNFHSLAPMGPAAPNFRTSTTENIGLEPVTLPASIDRAEVVLFDSASTPVVREAEAWIGPLGSMLTLVVAEELAGRLGVDQVYVLPSRRRIDLDRVIEIDVVALQIALAGTVRLEVTWRLFNRDDALSASGRIAVDEQYTPSETLDPAIAAVNRAMSQMTQQLAQSIMRRSIVSR